MRTPGAIGQDGGGGAGAGAGDDRAGRFARHRFPPSPHPHSHSPASSVRVARHTLRLVGPEGLLQLVHVEPSLDFPAGSVWGWGGCHAAAVSQGFTTLIAELEALGAKDVRTLSRVGDPVIELLRAAEASNADLPAIGSAGSIHDGRAVVGRAARRVMADPPLSLLVIPGLTTSEATVVEVPDVRGLPQPVTT